MNPRILNRAGKLPDDGFYQIEALGEHINHPAQVVQVIDAKAVESIVNRFNAEATTAGAEFSGMRIDKDHLSQSLKNPTESLGWNMQLRNREGIPEAKIEWTGLGLPLIESKPGQPPVYKFFSTEYAPADCERIGIRIVNRKTYAVVRPLRLDGLSLTNDPNNKGQRPISNRDGNPAGPAHENQSEKNNMKELLKALGLGEDASEASAVAALKVITNRATHLEAENATLLTAQVDADLQKYSNRFKPEKRETIKKALIANRAAAIDLLEATEAPEVKEPAERITNRQGAKPPAGGPTEPSAEDAKAIKITNRANELKGAAPARSFDACWRQAQNEAAAAGK